MSHLLYAIHDDAGRIIQLMSKPSKLPGSTGHVACDGLYSGDEYYVSAGAVVPRPVHDFVGAASIPNLTPGASVTATNEAGGSVVIEAGDTLVLIDPGTYMLTVTGPWPYQSSTVEVHND